MTSIALQYWRNHRLDYLDDLLVAHRLVRGSAIGRRRRMSAVNAALVLRLAAEFQGFARDLHEEASATFANWIATGNLVARSAAYDLLLNGRDLDRGNANPGALGRDFRRFGLDVWAEMAACDRRTKQLNLSLERLNAARNALAHADDAKLSALKASGCHIVLGTVRRWRRDTDVLASNLDVAVGDWLGQAFGRSNPW
jgi:hypothetical protein